MLKHGSESSDSCMSSSNVNKRPMEKPLCALALAAPLSIQYSDIRDRPAVVLSATSTLQERRRYHRRRRRRIRRRASRRQHERQGTNNAIRWQEQDVGGSGNRKNDDRWTLKEILDTLQHVWQTPPSSRQQQKTTYSEEESQSRFSSNGMFDRFRKVSCISTSEISSPIFLRRRLSAPETIMRKYVLAQRRAETQGSNDLSGMNNLNTLHQVTPTGASAITSVISSNPNLTRKRHDTMRKSTLIRRLWSNQPLLGGAYAEWQYSCGKVGTRSTHSLGSVQSSPEHGKLSNSRHSLPDEFRTSPKHISSSRRISPSHQANKSYLANSTGSVNSSHRKMSLYNVNCDNANGTVTTTRSYTTPVSNSSYMTNSDSNRSTRSNIDSSTKTDSIRNSTSNSTTMINYSEKSASTYTNSNYTTASNHDRLQNSNMDLQISSDIKNESSTQTTDTTNLNVISNIQLSEDTINLIYNQVMQDVNNISTPITSDMQRMVDGTSVNTNTKLYTVQQTPSFYLNQAATSSTAMKQFTDYSRIVKYMISNVEAGSSYKPAEVPQLIVPRYSALPRSTSMEVNTSSADSTDYEDTISLVDSLEEHISPRSDRIEITPKLTPPLPDNSSCVGNESTTLKPMSFYIPIATAEKKEDYKTMADHFPSHLREKISKRQKKCEEKRLLNKSKEFSPRSDSNYISASDNGTNVQYFINSTNSNDVACGSEYKLNKSKKKSKALLPIIEPINKIKAGNGGNERVQPIEEKLLSTRKQYPKLESSHKKCKESPWLVRNRSREKNSYVQTKLYTSTTDNLMHRQGRSDANSNSKRIEIMEIMEFVEPERNQGRRSKIPILVPQQQKLPKIPNVHTDKPIYLDFEQVEITDPKLDQLIANILIDTLHNPHFQSNVKLNQDKVLKKIGNINEKRPMDESQSKFINKYAQKFEAIPEEKSFQIVPEETSVGIKYSNNNIMDDSSAELLTSRLLINNNADVAGTERKESSYQGKAAIADNVTSLPKGWITFYTLRKSQSPDSTSDEGDQIMDIRNEQASSSHHAIRDEDNTNCSNEKSTSTKTYTSKDQRSNEKQQHVFKENANIQNAKIKNSAYRDENEMKQRWSLTLSGSSNCGQLPPELEMRLKFPSFSQTGSEESTIQEPSISTSRRTQTSRSHIDFDNRLPDIMHKSNLYRNGDSNMRQSMDVLTKGLPTNPRPTKTSTRRYCLTHNAHAQFGQKAVCNHNSIRSNRQQYLLNDGNSRYTTENRDFTEILRRFPELMEITGNNIVSERKPRMSLNQDYDYHQNTFSNIQR